VEAAAPSDWWKTTVVKLLKFAHDTTLMGFISDGDESAYRWEGDHLVTWCRENNLELNAVKIVEMVVDFRKNSAPATPTPSVTIYNIFQSSVKSSYVASSVVFFSFLCSVVCVVTTGKFMSVRRMKFVNGGSVLLGAQARHVLSERIHGI
jgi:hypothetical protein